MPEFIDTNNIKLVWQRFYVIHKFLCILGLLLVFARKSAVGSVELGTSSSI